MSRQKSRYSKASTATGSMAIALASLTVSACGGTGDRHPPENLVTSDAGLSVNPCDPAATLEMELIGCSPEFIATGAKCPDFEGHAPLTGKTDPDPLPVDKPPPGNAGWSISTCKDAPAGTDCISPNGIMNFYPMEDNVGGKAHCGMAPGASTNSSAYHMVARGQLRWGPQAYIQYDDGTTYPKGPVAQVTDLSKWATTAWGLDVSDWDGIAFWIRAGDQPLNSATPTNATLVTGNSVFVSFITPGTNAKANAPGGVRCNTAADAPDPEKCDDFGFPVAYSDKWEYKVLPFSDLRQRGFGVHEDKPDLNHLIQLKFGFEVGDYWNVWIDDISLWRKK